MGIRLSLVGSEKKEGSIKKFPKFPNFFFLKNWGIGKKTRGEERK